MDRHPRIQPAVYSVSVIGPYDAQGPGRHAQPPRILRLHARQAAAKKRPAPNAFSPTLMRRAYRRPVTDADLDAPAEVLPAGARSDGGFDAGIEMALRAVLVSPEFLFRVEQDPAGARARHGLPHQRSRTGVAAVVLPLEQHSRRRTARRRQPRQAAQRRRCSSSRCAACWPIRARARWSPTSPSSGCTCAISHPSLPTCALFPDFDDNLRQAFRQETELFFESILREDRSVLDLLQRELHVPQRAPGEALRNSERLRQPLPPRHVRTPTAMRGGLLRQGSILTVTSYATRTSPVIRGKWILANILGTPPPPPPPNVPALKENAGVGKTLSMRERLAEHRANPACAGLPQADGSGRLLARELRRRRPLAHRRRRQADRRLRRPARRQQVRRRRRPRSRRCSSRPELFVGTLTREAADVRARPRRRVLRRAGRPQDRARRRAPTDYRFSSLILGIVEQHAVSDEEVAMIITKKALPRRTFLRGRGRDAGAAAARRDGPGHDRPGRHAGQPGRAASGFVYMPMGAHMPRWTPPGAARSTSFRRPCSSLAPVVDQRHGDHQPGAAERLPGTHATSNAAFLSAATAKWTESTRLLPRHDRRPDRRPADRPRDAAAVARTGDGSAHHRRPVRQRLRLRLPEQSLLVVADDAAAGRGASAHRLRAPVRRWRQRRRSASPSCARTPACSIG